MREIEIDPVDKWRKVQFTLLFIEFDNIYYK